MANEDPNVLRTVLEFAQAYLGRPLTEVERQVLEAYIRGRPVDLAQGAQQSVEQARQRALEVIRSDGQRTRSLIDQLAGSRAADNASSAERDGLLRQLLAAAGSQAAAPAPIAAPAESSPVSQAPVAQVPTQAATPAPAPASAPADDPALKAMLSALVQQEVKAVVEVRMAELAQKVEDTLKQIQAASGQ